jgi:hypothetical protein
MRRSRTRFPLMRTPVTPHPSPPHPSSGDEKVGRATGAVVLGLREIHHLIAVPAVGHGRVDHEDALHRVPVAAHHPQEFLDVACRLGESERIMLFF